MAGGGGSGQTEACLQGSRGVLKGSERPEAGCLGEQSLKLRAYGLRFKIYAVGFLGWRVGFRFVLLIHETDWYFRFKGLMPFLTSALMISRRQQCISRFRDLRCGDLGFGV